VAESPFEGHGAHVVSVDRQHGFPSMADCVWYQESAQILGVRLPPDCGLRKCSVLQNRYARGVVPAEADRDLIVSQHHSDVADAGGRPSRPRATHRGSFCASEYTTVQLHTLDRSNRQCHRGGLSQMVYLRMAADTEFFQDVSNHRMALNSDGHSFELPSTGLDVPGLHTSREELELCVSGAL
jgi:hypothetical protein